MASTSDFQFYGKTPYFRQVVQDVEKSGKGDRILLTTMNFDPGDPEVSNISEALISATKRGANVTLMIDAHDFLQPDRAKFGPLWFHDEFPKRLNKTALTKLEPGRKIQAYGGTFVVINHPHHAFTSPVSGRSHIKTTIVNDKVYVGGCNLTDASQIDLMVGWRNQDTADWLYKSLRRVADMESTQKAFQGVDQTYQLDATSSLFIDSGTRNQSIIYDRALALIDSAKDSLVITCQFFPHGLTAQHLARAAARGVKVRILFNRPRKHEAYAPIQQAVIWQERLRGMPREFFANILPARSPYIHAKLLASESTAMIGSHNYVTEGVKFGTAEIALYREDPRFAQAAIAAIDQ